MNKKLLVSLFFIFTAIVAGAQGLIIEGNVYDSYSRQPVIGATVILKDNTLGVNTDIKGNFSLRVETPPPFILEVYFLGYKTQEIMVFEPEFISIPLVEDSNRLEEIVVVGYTQTRKSAMTSAVNTVKADELSNTASSSVMQKLQGAVPGLLISSNSGVPGTSQMIRLRGATSITANNSPLYVIDGVFLSNESLQTVALGGQDIDPLSELNSDDIESVTVLKDASATAAYGSRGANGMILINTKRGARNSQTRVNLKAEIGLSRSSNLWDLVTGPEHAGIVNAAWLNDRKSYQTRPFRPVSEAVTGYAAYGSPQDQPTYDRLSDVFRTAMQQKYNLSVTGGDEKTNFFVGGDFTKQEATLRLQDFTRYSFRVNIDHSIRSNLKLGTSNSLAYTDRSLVRVGDGPSGFFQAALHTPTFYPVYNEDGTYNKPVAFDNHQAMLDNWDGASTGLRSINNISLRWEITRNLSFKTSWSNDHNRYNEKFYYNTNLIGGQPDGSATDAKSSSNIFSGEQLLNYNMSFGRHFLSAYLGNSFQKRLSEYSSLTGTGFPNNEFKRIASASVTYGTSDGTSSSILSFFTGVNYSYDNRYSVDATLRADGSSRVGRDNRWGYFPSVGLAWNVANERFFRSSDFLNDLKLKGSFGLVGNESIGDFASLGLWGSGENYNNQPGIAPLQLANPDLRWETTRQWNVGLAASVARSRIDIELNYYSKYTYDLLLEETVADKTGFSSVTKNTGEVSNRGVEFQLTSLNMVRKDFSWTTGFAVSHNRNKVEKLPVEVVGSYQMFRLFEGYPLYSMWVYNYLGVDPQTGDAIYEDRDGSGTITVEDKKVVGNAWPRFEGSLRNTLNYKNFSLDIKFYFKYGNKVFNYTRSFLESGGTRGITRSIQRSSLNYWKQPGDTGVLPRPKSEVNSDGSYNYEQQSSRFVEDGSYLRLKDVTLAYTLPSRFTSRLGIYRANVYVTGTNLFLWTKYSGPDPEVNMGSGLVQGLDFGTPPQPRTFLVGINVTF